MDVSLVLKAFGSTTVVASVEEALAKFIETEKLEVGSALYFFETLMLT